MKIIKDTFTGQPLPFNVAEIEEDHPFQIALKRHEQSVEILRNLVKIESFRIDALNKMKSAEPGTDEHTSFASALSVLMSKRSDAKNQYRKYCEAALHELKKI